MKNITALSNHELLSQLERLSTSEHEATLELLLHLGVLGEGRLYAELGYSSLFSFLVEKLKYSESSANRRIRAARALSQYPELLPLLEKRAVSVTTVSMVSSILTKENAHELFSQVSGKTQREVEAIVSGYKPGALVRESIKPVAVKEDKRAAGIMALELKAHRGTVTTEKLESTATMTVNKAQMVVEVPAPASATSIPAGTSYKVQFGADQEFMNMLTRVKELSGSRDLASTFKDLMAFYLGAKAPEKREKRRLARAEKAKEKEVAAREKTRSRYIGAALRDSVLLKDNCRCGYVAPDGTRCTKRTELQIDHIQPFALGGKTEAGNLRTLCRCHNALMAEQVFGKDVIRGAIRLKQLGG